jgi:hypothetical protein
MRTTPRLRIQLIEWHQQGAPTVGGPTRRVAPADHAAQGHAERALGHLMEALRAAVYPGPRAALTWRGRVLLTLTRYCWFILSQRPA